MTIEKIVFRVAGSIILISVLLGVLHSKGWLFITAFVGANMIQASFTGLCPMAMLLEKLGKKYGSAFKN
jgi:hypothetical protein